MTQVAAAELGRYGVRVNCIAPGARTRMTTQTPGLEEMMAEPGDPDAFDPMDPANVSPLVAYLSSTACTVTGEVFAVSGGRVEPLEGWRGARRLVNLDRRPTIEEIAAAFVASQS